MSATILLSALRVNVVLLIVFLFLHKKKIKLWVLSETFLLSSHNIGICFEEEIGKEK